MNESHETIKKVAEEGLEARNLINYISDGSLDVVNKTAAKPPTSPRPHSISPKPSMLYSSKDVDSRILLKTKRRTALSRPKSRLRSASAGRNPEKDLRARYWTFLFENLHRAVDEIYQTCEMDESIVESKEAIMMLENYSKDFNALIQYININKDYEKTAPLNRPTSLAWEIRKSSPGKSLLKNVFIEKLTAGNSQAKRILCFDAESESKKISDDKSIGLKSDPNAIISCLKPLEMSIENEIQSKIAVENQDAIFDKKECATISVVPETTETFPCNDNLIINEIYCLSDKTVDKPNTETESESIVHECENLNDVPSEDCSKIDSIPENTGDEEIKSNYSQLEEEAKINESQLTEDGAIRNDEVIKSDTGTETEKDNATHNCLEISENEKNNSVGKVEDKTTQTKLFSEQDISTSCSIEKKKVFLKRKAVLKNTKVSSEKVNSVSCKPTVITEEKNPKTLTKSVVKTSDKVLLKPVSNHNENIPPKTSDKVLQKPLSNHNENVPPKKGEDITSTPKNAAPVVATKKTALKPSLEKPAPLIINRQPYTKPASATSKLSPRNDAPEEKKLVKSYSRPSAIQRNISYISTLSSRNQLEKAANEEKKKPLRTISHAMRMPPKSGSMSSLHKISASNRRSGKASSVEQIPEIIKSNTDEDSDGWETVRGRNRCRNSPAKKIPFSSEKNDKALDFAKLNQSRFGGFPYTTKGSAKSTPNKMTTKKDEKNGNKLPINENSTSKHVEVSSQVNTSSTKSSNKSSSNASVDNESKPTLDVASEIEQPSKSEILMNELIAELKLSDDVNHKIKCNNIRFNKLARSISLPCIYNNKSTFSLSKSKSMSEQSLHVKKYSKIMHFSRNFLEKNGILVRKKSRKSATKPADVGDDGLNTSLDESDTGLTSDDQDGQTSHDEAFDAHCQDLCDTAWKYKILEQQVHKLELSWGEQMDRFDMELRTPGRALEMHEKLSSPFRKKSLMESIRLQEEKQVKAREQRERLLEEKLKRVKEIEKKRLEMRTLLEERQEKQRILMEQKLQRAEEKRKKQLEMIVKKAHDEEEKVNEIAFINTLEAQNKRHDLISKEKDHEARLHDIQEERQRKQEEKAAKEAAAEERRKLLEAERLARLNEMQEKRKIKDLKVEQLFLVKEKERQELASQKARDREQRLSALNAQQQITIEELQKKIQLKQEESARRHEENMEQIRQKAFELSVRRCSSNNDDAPQPVPYETKKICTMCNVLIGSEVYLLSHLRGKKHQETVKVQYQGKDPSVEELELYNLKHIVDASTDQLDPNIALDKERQKALKKRCKKLRQRMSSRGQEYEAELEKSSDSINSNVKSRMSKITADIKKLITTYEKSSNEGNLLSALERCLNEIENVLEKKLYQDKVAFRMVGGLAAVIDIFKLVSCLPVEKSVFLHKKILNHLSNTAESIVDKCYENCMYILFSNKVGCLLDLLIQRLNVLIPNNCNQMIINTSKSPGLNIKVDIAAGKLMHFLSSILTSLGAKHAQANTNNVNEKENKSDEFQFRVQDVISFIVSIGIVDKLSQYFNSVQGPISNEAEVANFLLDSIAFLTSLIKLYSDCFTLSSNSKTEDSTQLIAAMKVTNMFGSVSLLYGLLLHGEVSSRGDTPPPQLPKQIESLVIQTLCMLNHMAVMNLQAFQTISGSEGLSLQLRHITSHLLWYCNHWSSDTLLHEVILLVGYFTVLNVDNQSLIQAGQRPTVLQQLCSLPFLYFSDSQLMDILFPTLITCCYNNPSNKTILQQEMSSEHLSNYIEAKYVNSDEYTTDIKKGKKVVPDKRWQFFTRFPKNCWSSAKHYFGAN